MTSCVALLSARRDARAFRTSRRRCFKPRIRTDRTTLITFARVDDTVGGDDLDDEDDDFWEEFGEEVVDDAAVVASDAQPEEQQSQQPARLSKEELRMEMAKPDQGASPLLPVIAGVGALLAAAVFFWRKRNASATDADVNGQVRVYLTSYSRHSSKYVWTFARLMRSAPPLSSNLDSRISHAGSAVPGVHAFTRITSCCSCMCDLLMPYFPTLGSCRCFKRQMQSTMLLSLNQSPVHAQLRVYNHRISDTTPHT